MDACAWLRECGIGSDELVVDAGGHEGGFASIAADLGCGVVVYEPHPEYAAKLRKRFMGGRVDVIQRGLWSAAAKREFWADGDRSSFVIRGGPGLMLPCVDVAGEVGVYGEVGLLKLNVEGDEYAILGRLVESGAIRTVKRLVVQFHRVDGESERQRDYLRGLLRLTHREAWCEPWVWEGWERAG